MYILLIRKCFDRNINAKCHFKNSINTKDEQLDTTNTIYDMRRPTETL